jgi:hypothetical protein
MADLRITELEFEQIKKNFIRYLESQTEFSDYNFTGSGLNTLLDVLSYNTHYNAMLAHLMANEMFIDTAQKRSSVVSIAKTLGYTPRSTTASTAKVQVIVDSSAPSPQTLPKYTRFSTNVDGAAFTFVAVDSYTANKVDGTFIFDEVVIKEGSPITQSVLITPDNVSKPIVIRNNNIDLSTLLVTVQVSDTNTTTKVFNRTTTVIDITRDDEVFWVEEGTDGFYHIVFGDNIIGKQLVPGNIVIMNYIACRGSEPNGAQSFSCQGLESIGTPVTYMLQSAAGGSDRETTDSIRFNAPRYNSTKDRAVTVEDYKALILSNFDKAKSVTVWGGEQNVPPIYGKVFISIDPKDDYIITELDKQNLINNVLKPKSVLSILHEFVEPVYLHTGMDIKVSYDARRTPFSAKQIETIVRQEVEDYFATELSTLEKKFYYSQLVNRIQGSHRAILGTLIDLRLQRRLIPILNVTEKIDFYFTTAIEPNSFRSTNFRTNYQGLSYRAYIRDLPDTVPPAKNGTGTLHLINAETGQIISNNYGKIYYGNSGLIRINEFLVTELIGATTDIRFGAIPQDLSKDLSPTIVRTTEESAQAIYPYPAQNVIVVLDDSEESRSLGTQSGLTITATPSEI